MQTVSLFAESAFGTSGQYIARITGRDPKFTFSRSFVGRKEGKRGDVTRHETDEPGLYTEGSVGKKGKTQTYKIVYALPEGLYAADIDEADAMALAKKIEGGFVDFTREALTARLAANESKDAPEQLVNLKRPWLGLSEGQHPRREIIAALRAQLYPEERRAAKAAAVARIWALMVELGVTLADLEAQ